MFFRTKEDLIQNLVSEGYLKNKSLIEAFLAVDRADFVPEKHKEEAYGNYPLPIGHSQTISQPLTVAFMLELLEPQKGEKILDIGSGSGWQTAILAHIVGDDGGKVIAVERIPEIVKMTEDNVSKFNFLEKGIVKVVETDGSKGYKLDAPYDKIVAAAAAESVPKAWKNQLKIGGKIVAPVGNSIYVLEKKNKDEFSEERHFGFSFVPLVGKGG